MTNEIQALRDALRRFAQARDWAQFLSPRSHDRVERPSKPRFRTPTRCTMGGQHYEGEGTQAAGQQVPKLRLAGRWLEACGFAVGDDLQVTVGQGMLLISRRASASG